MSEFIVMRAYGPKLKVGISFDPDEDMTKQSFKDECDINVIMRRYERTGVLEHVRDVQAQFGDSSGADFQAAMLRIAEAQSAFQELPSRIRDRFDNDPAQLMDFLQDADNAEEAAELGLLSEEAVKRLEGAKAEREAETKELAELRAARAVAAGKPQEKAEVVERRSAPKPPPP